MALTVLYDTKVSLLTIVRFCWWPDLIVLTVTYPSPLLAVCMVHTYGDLSLVLKV